MKVNKSFKYFQPQHTLFLLLFMVLIVLPKVRQLLVPENEMGTEYFLISRESRIGHDKNSINNNNNNY